MYCISSKPTSGNLAGIYNDYIYSGKERNKTLVIFRKKLTSIDGWEEYFDTNFILSKPLKYNCSNGLPVAFGVIDSFFLNVGRGKYKNVNGLHFFAINLHSKTFWDFEQSYPLIESDFQELCNECYQLNIFELQNRQWIINSWNFKSFPLNLGYEDIKWWSCKILKQIDESKKPDTDDNCYMFLNRELCSEPITQHQIISNIGIIENFIRHIYASDEKKIYVTGIANSNEPATISEESDLKEWDDIGFWNFNKKLYCLALKILSDKACEIQCHQIVVKYLNNNTYTGHPCIKFVQKFSFVLHNIFPNLHRFRFFVTVNAILFQSDQEIITVIDENGFNPSIFSKTKQSNGSKKQIVKDHVASAKVLSKKKK